MRHDENDGGTAATTYKTPFTEIQHRGLTIRDEFALAALPGLFHILLAKQTGSFPPRLHAGEEPGWLAYQAYQVATACMAERKRIAE